MLMMRNVLTTVWCRFGGWSLVIKVFVQTLSTIFQGLVKILKLMFRQDFEAEVWSLFCCWCLVVAMKFILGQDSGLVWSRFFSLSFVKMVIKSIYCTQIIMIQLSGCSSNHAVLLYSGLQPPSPSSSHVFSSSPWWRIVPDPPRLQGLFPSSDPHTLHTVWHVLDPLALVGCMLDTSSLTAHIFCGLDNFLPSPTLMIVTIIAHFKYPFIYRHSTAPFITFTLNQKNIMNHFVNQGQKINSEGKYLLPTLRSFKTSVWSLGKMRGKTQRTGKKNTRWRGWMIRAKEI